jgi:hypothetical protein
MGPLDLTVEGGGMLWGLLYNLAKMGLVLQGEYWHFLYPPDRLNEVLDYVRSLEPNSLAEESIQKSDPSDGALRGVVMLRRKEDGHHMVALLYEKKNRIVTILGQLPDSFLSPKDAAR